MAPGLVPPYGGAWQFRFANIVDDNPFGPTDANIVSITIQLSDEAPTATPPTSEALGTIGSPGTVFSRTFTAGQVQWFRFRIGEAATGAKYLDIDTEGSTITNQDTEIALYDAYGSLLAEDDDNGSVLLSQLTFGPSATTRVPIGTGAPGAIGTGAPGDGHHGALPAGTYYLAVSTWNATFNADYGASTNSSDTGSITVNFRTNLTAIPATVGGFVTLQNLIPDEAGTSSPMRRANRSHSRFGPSARPRRYWSPTSISAQAGPTASTFPTASSPARMTSSARAGRGSGPRQRAWSSEDQALPASTSVSSTATATVTTRSIRMTSTSSSPASGCRPDKAASMLGPTSTVTAPPTPTTSTS